MRKFILKYANGSIDIVTVLDESTNEQIIALCDRYQQNTGYRDIIQDNIPTDYITFRSAFEDSQAGDQIDISVLKARDYALVLLRAQRDEELHRLDNLKIRADELSLTELSTSILADKQVLRDCTESLKDMDTSGYNDTTKLDFILANMSLPSITN